MSNALVCLLSANVRNFRRLAPANSHRHKTKTSHAAENVALLSPHHTTPPPKKKIRRVHRNR